MTADLSSLQALGRSAIDETTLIAALSRIRARDALLFLDTCYSGAVTADALANVGHETGRYLLAASSSVQEALDSYDNRNGVFVYAVREGLEGRASHGADDIVSALALGEYVSGRVGVLARQKNHDQDAVFKTAQEELHSFPIGDGDRRRAVAVTAPILLSRKAEEAGRGCPQFWSEWATTRVTPSLPSPYVGEGGCAQVVFVYRPSHSPLAGCNVDE